MLPPPRLWVRIVLLLRELRLGAALVPALAAVVLAATVFPGPWDAKAGPAAAVPVGEVVSLRSARSATFAKGDGSFETRLTRQSINWFDPAEKAWKPIDPSLRVSARAGVGWESGQNRFSVELADQSKAGLIAFVSHGKRMRFSPVDAAPGKPGSRADGASAVVYRGVYPDVDVEYAVLPDGLKETIVLRKPGAPSSYLARLEPEPGDKWRAEQLGVNGPWAFFVNGAPEPEFVLLPPTVGDSSFETSRLSDPTAIPHALNVFPGMASLVVSEQKDGSFLATVAIDEKWLADPERVFPVAIDPTVYSTPDVADGWYDTTNGGNPTLETMVSVGPAGIGSPNRMGVLTFDVAAIPPAATVSGASLNMLFENCYPGSCQGNDSGTVRLRRLTAGWSASTPWSAISGQIDGTTLAQMTFPYPWSTPTQTWRQWSGTGLTSALQGMVNGSIPNYGFILDESQGNNWNGWWFRSSLFADPSYTPYLDVTWSSDGVQVDPALSVHSNGAELRWQHYPAGPITGFERFEIHRSATAGFTPSASTLVATLGDDAWQTYRDTSAKPGTFHYRVVTVTGAGSFSSNEVEALLPASGEASVTVQPGYISSSAKGTYISSGDPNTPHGNSQFLVVGSAPGSTTRTLLQFDLHSVPTGVTVTDAKLELYALQSTSAAAIGAHRISAWWEEGGATWFQREYQGGVAWATPGGDYDPGSAGANLGGANVHWESIPLTGLVQDWVNGAKSHLGLIVRYGAENGAQPTQFFAADGFVRSIALRPKLVVTFEDDSASVAPTVAISEPQAGELVKGTVTLKAGALDDGSITQVEFFDGATPIGAADTTAPFEVPWVTAGRGASSLTAKATDDAGNVTTSQPVAVTRANSAAPTTSITSATAGAGGVWTVNASAGDDIGVSKVEFYVDDDRFASDQSSPYSASLDTLAFPVYDGSHTLTTRASDADGNATVSAGSPVTVANTSGVYKATIAASDVPLELSSELSAGGSVFPHGVAVVDDFNRASLGADWSAPFVASSYVRVANSTWAAATGSVLSDGRYLPVSCGSCVVYATVSNVPSSGDRVGLWARASSAGDGYRLQVRKMNGVDTWTIEKATGGTTFTQLGTVVSQEIVNGNRIGLYADGSTLEAYLDNGSGWSLVMSRADSSYASGQAALEIEKQSARIDDFAVGAPQAVQPASPVTVSLTNDSQSNWPSSSIKLRYRWLSADATPTVVDSGDTSIGADLGAGQQRDVTLDLEPPALPSGVLRARYRLRIDLYDTTASSYFAAQGNKPFERWVTVTQDSPAELGLERYQAYDTEELGGGLTSHVNLANGNNLVEWTPFSQPGRGLDTVVRLAYNSLEHGSVSPVGNNWSLAISSLTPFGLPLDVHPNAADTQAGRSDKWVGFTDGDGTYHRFEGNAAGTYYTPPPGVELYLKQTGGTGWEVWKPDRTRFVYDADGFPVKVADANGNELTFTLATPAAGEDPYGLGKRVTTVTDAGGRDFTLTYWTKTDTPTTAMRGKVRTITDHLGHALELSYYEDGNLRTITEQGGPGDDGMPTPDRTVTFAYLNMASTGPAIGTLGGRQDPDPETVQSPVLYSVIDFKGQETQFECATTGANTGRLLSRMNRLGGATNKTTFAYPSATSTTVTLQLSRVWEYAFDAEGRVTQITDPLDRSTQVEWTVATPLNHVHKVTQPSGEFTEYTYNPNGYAVSEKDELGNETTYGYDNSAVDANDVSGNWETGRSIGHISQLASVTKPRGNATTGNPTDYRSTFTYTQQPTDSTSGLVKTITDPLGNVTSNSWNANGTLASQTLPANGDGITRTTTFNTYDANGLPTKVTDAAGGVSEASYRADGLPVYQRDPVHASAQAPSASDSLHVYYDAFGRERRSSTPKSSTLTLGLLVWQTQAYDANDNVTAVESAHYGRGDGQNGALTTTTFDALDRPTLETGPRTAAEGGPTSVETEYDAGGRVIRVTKPRGVNTTPAGSAYEDDFVAETVYDLLDRPLSVTAYAVDGSGNVDTANTRVAKHCYDLAGDLRSTTAPKGSAGLSSCPDPAADPYVYTTASHTTKLEYDAAHRLVKTTDAEGNTTEIGYDENGQVTSETDELGTVTTSVYDDRGDRVSLEQPFDTGRTITTKWEHGPLGNVKRLISPRAFDAASGGPTFTDYVESYAYDALGRLVTTTLPAASGTTQAYRHYAYDADGRLLWTSLPTASATSAGVTAAEKTQNSYWDTGAIYSQQQPALAKQRFDYTAEGWQTSRVPEIGWQPGVLDYPRSMSWRYTPDGLLSALLDDGGERATYDYDADGSLTDALEATGLIQTGQAPLPVELAYDSLDQRVKVRVPKPGSANWLGTVYGYDLHGNRATEETNREETSGGSTVTAGRVSTFAYDSLDRAIAQVDDFATGATSDDEQLLYAYSDRGELTAQTLQKGGAGAWASEQSSERTYFDNGLLKSLTNRNAAGAMVEQHGLSYVAGGVFVNGNRVSDVFQLKGPDPAASCYASTCTATWSYDARDRLTAENTGAGLSTAFTLDVAGNVTQETPTPGSAITRTFNGQQLATQSEGGTTVKFLYDSLGNQDCKVKSSYALTACPSSGAELLEDWSYDYKNRLASYRSLNGSGGTVNSVSWTNDPLDRPVGETSTVSGATTNHAFSYVGASDLLSQETLTGATSATRTYTYDAFGRRATITDNASRYSYLYDWHGSVSLLVDYAGSNPVTASYGYTSYGSTISGLTTSAAGFNAPTNAYRYTGKRADTGSGTLDMGARRFSVSTNRFLQIDQYVGALDNLGLSLDPLTQNRYALAGGNPVTYVEVDGHYLAEDTIADGIGHQAPRASSDWCRAKLGQNACVDVARYDATHMQAPPCGRFCDIGKEVVKVALPLDVDAASNCDFSWGHAKDCLLAAPGVGKVTRVTRIGGRLGDKVANGYTWLKNLRKKREAAKAGSRAADDAFEHGYKYHPRLRQRGVEDPRAHNFPYSFDDVILKQKPVTQADGSLLYRKPGSINRKDGVYEIAVNPQTGTIFHRTWRSR